MHQVSCQLNEDKLNNALHDCTYNVRVRPDGRIFIQFNGTVPATLYIGCPKTVAYNARIIDCEAADIFRTIKPVLERMENTLRIIQNYRGRWIVSKRHRERHR